VADGEVAGDAVAVVREALTNAARHAHATSVDVEVNATANRLSVEVADNGVGIGVVPRRSGLANLRERAEKHGGTLSLLDQDGTRLRWMVPLR
jgi:two-component system, NarL family, sensor histidine kinase DevS